MKKKEICLFLFLIILASHSYSSLASQKTSEIIEIALERTKPNTFNRLPSDCADIIISFLLTSDKALKQEKRNRSQEETRLRNNLSLICKAFNDVIKGQYSYWPNVQKELTITGRKKTPFFEATKNIFYHWNPTRLEYRYNAFPDSVTKLTVKNNNMFGKKALTNLPPKLKKLIVSCCENFGKNKIVFSDSIEIMDIFLCDHFGDHEIKMPFSLQILTVESCINFGRKDLLFSKNLKYLSVTHSFFFGTKEINLPKKAIVEKIGCPEDTMPEAWDKDCCNIL